MLKIAGLIFIILLVVAAIGDNGKSVVNQLDSIIKCFSSNAN